MSSPNMNELLESLGEAPEAVFEAGQTLVREGGSLDRIFVMVEGEVQLAKRDVPICKIATPGSVYGEMSSLLGIKPTASVVASRRTTVRVIEDPAAFLAGNAEATLAVARLLAHRVHWLTARYARELDDQDSLYWRWH